MKVTGNCLTSVLALGLGTLVVHGSEVLLSNLNEPWTDGGVGDFRGVFPGGISEPFPSAAFRTGPAAAHLEVVRLEHGVAAVPPITDSMVLRLYKFPTGGLPQGIVPETAQLRLKQVSSDPTLDPGFTKYADYVAASSLFLEPNTSYLLGTSLPIGADDATLRFVHFTAGNGTPGWSIEPFAAGGTMQESGEIWWDMGLSPVGLKFELRGTVIPEPKPAQILAAGLAGLLLLARRLA